MFFPNAAQVHCFIIYSFPSIGILCISTFCILRNASSAKSSLWLPTPFFLNFMHAVRNQSNLLSASLVISFRDTELNF